MWSGLCCGRKGGGDCEAGPSQALLGCTQSQPNKKPFIGRVQLSQTGWEHVAFKNEEGGIRGGGKEETERGGWEAGSRNEDYDLVRKTDNRRVRWARHTEAEILIDRELHKADCVFPVTFEILLSQFCQGWFHPGNGETDGFSLSYGLHVGGERVLLGKCMQQQWFHNRSLIYPVQQNNTSLFLAFIKPSHRRSCPRETVLLLPLSFFLHALGELFVFPSLHKTRPERGDMQTHTVFMYVAFNMIQNKVQNRL